jgi:hypothetical protein
MVDSNLQPSSRQGYFEKSLEMEEPQAIRDYLGKILDKAGLGGLIRTGK